MKTIKKTLSDTIKKIHPTYDTTGLHSTERVLLFKVRLHNQNSLHQAVMFNIKKDMINGTLTNI